MLLGCPDRHPDRLGRAEPVRGANDRALAQEPLLEGPRILAELDEDEVRDRARNRVEAVLAEHPLELTSPFLVQHAPAPQLRMVVEARERRLLGGCGDVECAPHLRQLGHHLRRGDGITDAEPGEPVDLRERAQHDHVAALRGSRSATAST